MAGDPRLLLTVDPTAGVTHAASWREVVTEPVVRAHRAARTDLEPRWRLAERLRGAGFRPDDCGGRDTSGVERRVTSNLEFCMLEGLGKHRAIRFDAASGACTIAHQPDAEGCWHRPVRHVPEALDCGRHGRGAVNRPAFCRWWRDPWMR